jgi:hypothetical protein
MIGERLARKFFGSYKYPDFDPSKHQEEDRYICKYSGKRKARNQMRWFVKRGDHLGEDSPTSVTHTYFMHVFPEKMDSRLRNFSVRIIEYDGDDVNPPTGDPRNGKTLHPIIQSVILMPSSYQSCCELAL